MNQVLINNNNLSKIGKLFEGKAKDCDLETRQALGLFDINKMEYRLTKQEHDKVQKLFEYISDVDQYFDNYSEAPNTDMSHVEAMALVHKLEPFLTDPKSDQFKLEMAKDSLINILMVEQKDNNALSNALLINKNIRDFLKELIEKAALKYQPEMTDEKYKFDENGNVFYNLVYNKANGGDDKTIDFLIQSYNSFIKTETGPNGERNLVVDKNQDDKLIGTIREAAEGIHRSVQRLQGTIDQHNQKAEDIEVSVNELSGLVKDASDEKYTLDPTMNEKVFNHIQKLINDGILTEQLQESLGFIKKEDGLITEPFSKSTSYKLDEHQMGVLKRSFETKINSIRERVKTFSREFQMLFAQYSAMMQLASAISSLYKELSKFICQRI